MMEAAGCRDLLLPLWATYLGNVTLGMGRGIFRRREGYSAQMPQRQSFVVWILTGKPSRGGYPGEVGISLQRGVGIV